MIFLFDTIGAHVLDIKRVTGALYIFAEQQLRAARETFTSGSSLARSSKSCFDRVFEKPEEFF